MPQGFHLDNLVRSGTKQPNPISASAGGQAHPPFPMALIACFVADKSKVKVRDDLSVLAGIFRAQSMVPKKTN